MYMDAGCVIYNDYRQLHDLINMKQKLLALSVQRKSSENGLRPCRK